MSQKALLYSNYRIFLPNGELPNLADIPKEYIVQHTQFRVGEFVAISAEDFPDQETGFHSLRQVLDDFEPDVSGSLVKGMQLSQWDKLSRHCGVCGSPNKMQNSEIGKACSQCGQTHYPFIQPVAIVLIRRGQELLLARGMPPRKHHSCLAGFIEVGESVEGCIHREVKEEVGVEVQNIRYFGSQPWPFPSNLMLAFTAEFKSGDIVLDETEITDARWFTKDSPPEVIPPKASIARKMIDSVWT